MKYCVTLFLPNIKLSWQLIYLLLQFYLLICLRIQQFGCFLISFVNQSIDIYKLPYIFCCLFWQLIHIFQYFLRLCLSSQECTHLMGKIVLGVGSSEIGFSTNIVPITLQLTLIGFFSPLGILLLLNISVYLNQYRGKAGAFNNRNYDHNWLSL